MLKSLWIRVPIQTESELLMYQCPKCHGTLYTFTDLPIAIQTETYDVREQQYHFCGRCGAHNIIPDKGDKTSSTNKSSKKK